MNGSLTEKGHSLTAPVRMTLHWFVRPPELGSITSALYELMAAARCEPGCLGCRLSTEMGQTVGVRYVEDWREEADLRRQLCSDRFARLAELMERATECPAVEFSLPCGMRSLDYAAEVREECAEMNPEVRKGAE